MNHTTPLDPTEFCCASKPFLCRTCSQKLFGRTTSFRGATTSSRTLRRNVAATTADDTPDPYRAATEAAERRRPDPSMDPDYQPHGRPADGYRIALALREAQEKAR